MFIITRSVNLLKVHDGLSPNCKCFFFSVCSFGWQVTQTINTTDRLLQMLLRLKCSLWWASWWVSWCPGSYRGWCKQDTVKILPIKLGCSGNRTSANAEMWLLLCKCVQILKNSGSKQTMASSDLSQIPNGRRPQTQMWDGSHHLAVGHGQALVLVTSRGVRHIETYLSITWWKEGPERCPWRTAYMLKKVVIPLRRKQHVVCMVLQFS